MKRPKYEVDYRMGGKHCHACKFYRPRTEDDGECQLVSGDIGAHMVCNLFARKEGMKE